MYHNYLKCSMQCFSQTKYKIKINIVMSIKQYCVVSLFYEWDHTFLIGIFKLAFIAFAMPIGVRRNKRLFPFLDPFIISPNFKLLLDKQTKKHH